MAHKIINRQTVEITAHLIDTNYKLNISTRISATEQNECEMERDENRELNVGRNLLAEECGYVRV